MRENKNTAQKKKNTRRLLVRNRKERERTVTVNEARKSKEKCVCMGIIATHTVGPAD